MENLTSVNYLIEVNNLKRRINGFLLNDISFSLEPGYIMGIIGRNGSGKSSLIEALLGGYRIAEGCIKVDGYDMRLQEKEAKQQMGFVLAEYPFDESLSAKEIGILYGRFYRGWKEEEYNRRLALYEVNPKKAGKRLSKGMRMKLQFAFALSHESKLLLLDEPTEGLDPIFRKEFIKTLYDFIADGTRSIILSTQLAEEIEQFGDYLLMLDKGGVKLFMSMEELREAYFLVEGNALQMQIVRNQLLGKRQLAENVFEGLIYGKEEIYVGVSKRRPTLEEVLYYMSAQEGVLNV